MTLLPFVLVIDPGMTLTITPDRYHRWLEIAEHGGFLVWTRDGMTRKVMADVLLNALGIFSEYRRMIEAGRIVDMPHDVPRILWEQATPLKETNRPITPC